MNTPLQHVLRQLEGTRETGSGWQARCPAHDDAHPSLSVGESDEGAVLLKCHFGCSTEAILEAAGLAWGDLFSSDASAPSGDGVATAPPPQLPQKPRTPEVEGIPSEDVEAWRGALLDGEGRPAEAARRYLTEKRGLHPKMLRTHFVGLRRFRGKWWICFPVVDRREKRVQRVKRYGFDPAACQWIRRDGKKVVRTDGGGSGLYWTAGLKATTGLLLLCEGEIDALHARQHGFAAVTGTAGAGTFKRLWAEAIAAADVASRGVVICYDGDAAGRGEKPGQEGRQKPARLLTVIGADVRMGELPEGKDVNDVLRDGGKEALQEIVQQATPYHLPPERTGEGENAFSQNPRPTAKERKSLFRSAAEISEAGLPDPAWLVDGLLPEGAVVLLSGAAKGAGKTTFAVHLARALLTGQPFLDRPTSSAPVAYLTEQAVGNFFGDYLRPAGIEEAEGLKLLFGYETVGSGQSWQQTAWKAAEAAADAGARTLFVDTFLHFAGLTGEQENSSGAVQTALRPLQHAAAKLGLTIVVIHHNRKGGGDQYNAARGSSAFQGAADLIFNLARPPGNQRRTVRELSTAGRFSDVPEKLMIELQEDTDGHTRYDALGSEHDVAARSARSTALRVAPTSEGDALRLDDLLDAAREEDDALKETTFRNAVKKLTGSGKLREIGDGVKGDPYRYFRPLEEKAR